MVFSSLFQPARQSLSWCICELQGRRNRKHFSKMVSPLVKRSIVWSKNPPYSDYHKQLKIILVLLNFQRKSKRHVEVAKKKIEVGKVNGLCLWHLPRAILFEMSPKNWVKTEICEYYKKELIYHVDIMLMRQVTEC